MKKKLNKELDYEKTGVFESSNSGKEGGLSQQGLVTPLLQFANQQKNKLRAGAGDGVPRQSLRRAADQRLWEGTQDREKTGKGNRIIL